MKKWLVIALLLVASIAHCEDKEGVTIGGVPSPPVGPSYVLGSDGNGELEWKKVGGGIGQCRFDEPSDGLYILNCPGFAPINNPMFTGTVSLAPGSSLHLDGNLNIGPEGSLTFDNKPVGGVCEEGEFVNAISSTFIPSCSYPVGGGGSIFTGPTPPENPSTGTPWYDSSSTPHILKIWDGITWVVVSSGNTHTGPTAPENPTTGALWSDTTTTPPTLRIWDGTRWVAAHAGVMESPTFEGTVTMPDGSTWDSTGLVAKVGSFTNLTVGGLPVTTGGPYLPLAGGIITGNLTVNGTSTLYGNVAVNHIQGNSAYFGNLSGNELTVYGAGEFGTTVKVAGETTVKNLVVTETGWGSIVTLGGVFSYGFSQFTTAAIRNGGALSLEPGAVLTLAQNAVGALQAVPLQQLQAAIAGSTSAGTTAPGSPTLGQFWYDTTNPYTLKIYNGSGWTSVSGTITGGTCSGTEFVQAISSAGVPSCATPSGGGSSLPTPVSIANGGTGGDTAPQNGYVLIASSTTRYDPVPPPWLSLSSGGIVTGNTTFGGNTTFTGTVTLPAGTTINNPTFTGTLTLPNSSVTDAMLTDSYSGTGACTTGQYVHTLNRNAAPTCSAPPAGLPASGGTLTGSLNIQGGLSFWGTAVGGTCPDGQFVNSITGYLVPGCAAIPSGGAPINNPTFTGTVTTPNLTVTGSITVPNASIVDAKLASSYSGVGTCTTGQYVTALLRNAAPTCAAPTLTGYLPVNNPTFTGLMTGPTYVISGTAGDTVRWNSSSGHIATIGIGGGYLGDGTGTPNSAPFSLGVSSNMKFTGGTSTPWTVTTSNKSASSIQLYGASTIITGNYGLTTNQQFNPRMLFTISPIAYPTSTFHGDMQIRAEAAFHLPVAIRDYNPAGGARLDLYNNAGNVTEVNMNGTQSPDGGEGGGVWSTKGLWLGMDGSYPNGSIGFWDWGGWLEWMGASPAAAVGGMSMSGSLGVSHDLMTIPSGPINGEIAMWWGNSIGSYGPTNLNISAGAVRGQNGAWYATAPDYLAIQVSPREIALYAGTNIVGNSVTSEVFAKFLYYFPNSFFTGLALSGAFSPTGMPDYQRSALNIGNSYYSGNNWATANISGAAYFLHGAWYGDCGAGGGVGLLQMLATTLQFYNYGGVGCFQPVGWNMISQWSFNGMSVSHIENIENYGVPRVTSGVLVAGSRDMFGWIEEVKGGQTTLTFDKEFDGESNCTLTDSGQPMLWFNANQTTKKVTFACVKPWSGEPCDDGAMVEYHCFGQGDYKNPHPNGQPNGAYAN